MTDFEKEVRDKFLGLEKKLKSEEIEHFSENSIREFCRGFDQPIVGSLAYLERKTTSYLTLHCIISGDQISNHTVTDFKSYGNAVKDIINISPRARIDFTFQLSESIYGIGDIEETVSVFYSNDKYEIVYQFGSEKEFRYEKKYMSHITPEEIVELRDKICDNIFKRISAMIDRITD